MQALKTVIGFTAAALALAVLPLARARAAAVHDFYFTRLSYESGDWDVDERAPSNILNALIEYTTIRVDLTERVIALADPAMLTAPFCYLAGRRLLRFNHAEKSNFERYVRNGGFVFVDDCNHDIDGLFAESFEAQMAEIFGPYRTRDYTLGMVEFLFDAEATESYALPLLYHIRFTEAGDIEVESFGTQPFRVMNVTPEKVQGQ